MTRPPFIKHWHEVLEPDDSHYPESTELHSIGAPIGRATGLTRIGVHHEILPPGRRTSFPHAEQHEEELVFVLEGAPDVWIDGHLHRLAPGDTVGFPSGTGIAHTFINDTASDVKLLVVGERNPGGGVFYPLNPEVNARIGEKLWPDVPARPLGPHDGRPSVSAEGTRPSVPTMETVRLVLRRLTPDDAPMRVAMRSDPEHVRFLLAGPPPSLEEARAKLEWIVRDMMLGRSKGWAIVRKSDQEVVGQCGIIRVDAANRSASIAWELRRAVWGQGIAREAVTRMLEHGFSEMALHRIQAEIAPGNARSIRLAESLGFVYEGTHRGAHHRDGAFYDDAIYAKLAPA